MTVSVITRSAALFALVLLFQACGSEPPSPAEVPARPSWHVSQLDATQDGDWAAAVDALHALVEADEVDLDALEALLRDERPRRCRAAAEVLGRFGEDAVAAVPVLAAVVRGRGASVGGAAAWALAQTGDAGLRALASLLASGDRKAYPLAAHALQQPGLSLDEVVPDLARALSHESWEVRWAAMRVLERAGTAAAPYVLSLAVPPFDPAQDERQHEGGDPLEAVAWGIIVNAGEGALPLFVDTLHPEHPPRETRAAVRAMATIGEPAAPCIPLLVDALGWAEGNLEREILRTLGALGEAALAFLGRRLDSEDSAVRLEAADLMARIGTAEAAYHLGARLTGDDPLRRAAAARALRHLAFETDGDIEPDVGDRAVTSLLDVLTDPDVGVRREVIHALTWFPSETHRSIPALERALDDEDPSVQELARKAIRFLRRR